MATETTNTKTVNPTHKLFVEMWNKNESKSKIILAVYDTGLTVSGVLKVFQHFKVPMIYNHIYNVVSKARPSVRTEKGSASDRQKIELQ